MSLATASSRALGTSLHVAVTVPGLLDRAREAVDHVVRDIDASCSRFRDDSELSQLNAVAGREVAVSPLLTRALAAALRGAEVNGGAVDPTVGEAIKSAGYNVDFAQVVPELVPSRSWCDPSPDGAASGCIRELGE